MPKRKGHFNNSWNKKDKEAILKVIKENVELGYSNYRAAVLAKFPPTTFEEWVRKDVALRLELEALRGSVSVIARKNKVNAIKIGNLSESDTWVRAMEKREWREQTEVINYESEADPDAEDEIDELVEALTEDGLV